MLDVERLRATTDGFLLRELPEAFRVIGSPPYGVEVGSDRSLSEVTDTRTEVGFYRGSHLANYRVHSLGSVLDLNVMLNVRKLVVSYKLPADYGAKNEALTECFLRSPSCHGSDSESLTALTVAVGIDPTGLVRILGLPCRLEPNDVRGIERDVFVRTTADLVFRVDPSVLVGVAETDGRRRRLEHADRKQREMLRQNGREVVCGGARHEDTVPGGLDRNQTSGDGVRCLRTKRREAKAAGTITARAIHPAKILVTSGWASMPEMARSAIADRMPPSTMLTSGRSRAIPVGDAAEPCEFSDFIGSSLKADRPAHDDVASIA